MILIKVEPLQNKFSLWIALALRLHLWHNFAQGIGREQSLLMNCSLCSLKTLNWNSSSVLRPTSPCQISEPLFSLTLPPLKYKRPSANKPPREKRKQGNEIHLATFLSLSVSRLPSYSYICSLLVHHFFLPKSHEKRGEISYITVVPMH